MLKTAIVLLLSPLCIFGCSFNTDNSLSGGGTDDAGRESDASISPIDSSVLVDATLTMSDAEAIGSYSKRIAISSRPSLDTNDPLAGFVINLHLNADADLKARSLATAADVHFTASTGQTLVHEIESYDSSTGTLVAWVRLLSFPSSGTEIVMHYGDHNNLQLIDSTATWNTGFVGVWHFSDAPSALGEFADSTGKGSTTRQGVATSIPSQVAGPTGRALSFDGVDDILAIPTSTSPTSPLNFVQQDYSFSLWLNAIATGGQIGRERDVPFHKGGRSFAGYGLELGSSNWNVLLTDDKFIVLGPIGLESEFTARWVLLSVVVNQLDSDSMSYSIFVNGQLAASSQQISGFGDTSGVGPATIGGGIGTRFEGAIDELRVHSRALSADWISAEWNNLNSPSTFYSVGAEVLTPL